MAAVPFDTLKAARRFQTAGFAPQQAGDMAEALAEAMSGADLATEAALAVTTAALEAQIAAVTAEVASLGVD
jgi:hypothetical protein